MACIEWGARMPCHATQLTIKKTDRKVPLSDITDKVEAAHALDGLANVGSPQRALAHTTVPWGRVNSGC